MSGRVGRLAMLDAPPETVDAGSVERYPISLDVAWDGSHLLAAWHRQRDALLYAPWYDRRAAAARALDPDPDLDALQDRVTATLAGRTTDPAFCRDVLSRSPGQGRRFPAAPVRETAAMLRRWFDERGDGV